MPTTPNTHIHRDKREMQKKTTKKKKSKKRKKTSHHPLQMPVVVSLVRFTYFISISFATNLWDISPNLSYYKKDTFGCLLLNFAEMHFLNSHEWESKREKKLYITFANLFIFTGKTPKIISAIRKSHQKPKLTDCHKLKTSVFFFYGKS